jgi:hypothetical protein
MLLYAITYEVHKESTLTIGTNVEHMHQLLLSDWDGDSIIELSQYFANDQFFGDCRVTSPTIALMAYDLGLDPKKLFFLYVKDNIVGFLNSGHMITLYKDSSLESPIVFDAIYFFQTGSELNLTEDGKYYNFENGSVRQVRPHHRKIYPNLLDAQEKLKIPSKKYDYDTTKE